MYRAGRFDVLFPTQEQVAVLARCPRRLAEAGVRTAVPSFEALARVQDKVSADATLAALGLPRPATTVVASAAELAAFGPLPVFVKTPIGTATTGVRWVGTGAELAALAAEWGAAGAFAGGGVLAQRPAAGPLVMAQSVFAHGDLLAWHANLRVREGAAGGASHKRSIALPSVRDHLRRLGDALCWDGALSADAVLTEHGPLFIDINPRLVEPGNAWRAGVDLVTPLLDVALGACSRPQPDGAAGVATHQLLLAVLGAAQRTGSRRAVAAELASAVHHGGAYRDSAEELTPLRGDLRSVVPTAAAVAATVARPAAWRRFCSGAVSAYALTPAAWAQIVGHRERPT